MHLIVDRAAEIALNSLSDEERRRVTAWFTYFRRYDEDPYIREKSRELPQEEGVYYFSTSDDMAIFFRVEGDTITILDLARPSWLSKFSRWFGLVPQ